jgi:hypothetical protein
MTILEKLEEIAWLAKQAGAFALVFWPVTLALIAFAIITWLLRRREGSKHTLLMFSEKVWLIAPIVFSIASLVWGSLMWWPSNGPGLAPLWPLVVIYFFVGAQILMCIVLVINASHFRPFAIATSALQLWIGCLVGMVSGMAVTGNWI